MSLSSPEERRFREAYGLAIADALMEREDGSSSSLANTPGDSSSPSNKDTYRAMCHDEPTISSGGDASCRGLAEALVLSASASTQAPETNKDRFALSDRLVSGILQATQKSSAKTNVPPSQVDETKDVGDDSLSNALSEHLSLRSSTVSATSVGYAELYFAAFVQGPLLCCQSPNAVQPRTFLGSFSGLDTRHTEESSSSKTDVNRLHPLEQPPVDDDDDDDDNVKILDPTEELIADESDPDDYEYDSGWVPPTNWASDSEWMAFDPIQLSQPPKLPLTKGDIQARIQRLMKELSYSRLCTISKARWNKLDASSKLIQLTLILLQHSAIMSTTTSNKNSWLLHDYNNNNNHDGNSNDNRHALMYEWTKPLLMLRDRALDSSHGHDAMDDYLSLLTTLVRTTTQQHSQSIARDNNASPLDMAQAASFMSISALCTSKEVLQSPPARTKLRKLIVVDILDDLVDILEGVRPKHGTNNPIAKKTQSQETVESNGNEGQSPDLPSWVHVIVAILPMMDFCTNLTGRFDCTPLVSKASGGGGDNTRSSLSLSSKDAQSLLNSSLFRELILFYTNTAPVDAIDMKKNDEADSTVETVRRHLLRTLFILCAQSTNILAKYASRVPEFARIVFSSVTMEQNTIDGILWSTLGASVLGGSSSTSRLRLKTTGPTALSAEGLHQQATSGFGTLCGRLEAEIRKESQSLSDVPTKALDTGRVDPVVEFITFCNCLQHVPFVATAWVASMETDDPGYKKTRQLLTHAKDTIAKYQTASSSAVVANIDKNDDNKTGSKDKPNAATKTAPHHIDDSTWASLRRCIKLLSLLLELKQQVGVANTNVHATSSKTD